MGRALMTHNHLKQAQLRLGKLGGLSSPKGILPPTSLSFQHVISSGSSRYLPTLNSFFLGTVCGPCVDLPKIHITVCCGSFNNKFWVYKVLESRNWVLIIVVSLPKVTQDLEYSRSPTNIYHTKLKFGASMSGGSSAWAQWSKEWMMVENDNREFGTPSVCYKW